jgi:hypothetical protein
LPPAEILKPTNRIIAIFFCPRKGKGEKFIFRAGIFKKSMGLGTEEK